MQYAQSTQTPDITGVLTLAKMDQRLSWLWHHAATYLHSVYCTWVKVAAFTAPDKDYSVTLLSCLAHQASQSFSSMHTPTPTKTNVFWCSHTSQLLPHNTPFKFSIILLSIDQDVALNAIPQSFPKGAKSIRWYIVPMYIERHPISCSFSKGVQGSLTNQRGNVLWFN